MNAAAQTIGMEAIWQVPRVLGMVDRDRESPTYGCADRYFWHYKLHDFPNARFQEVSEVLALAFSYKHPLNPYYMQERIREWAVASARYWEKIRRGDGSFDEAYPFERSLCATAFSTMHVTHALILLSVHPSADPAVTGRWLARHDTSDTANQSAASAAALANLAVLAGTDAFHLAAGRRVSRLRDEYQRIGHFNEYGGSDLGYASITLSALASYAGHARDAETKAWVKSGAEWLASHLGEDGSFDYAGQSRSTRFFYPYSLAWSDHPCLEKIACGLADGKILNPAWMDDRYMVPFTADYLRCALRASSAEDSSG